MKAFISYSHKDEWALARLKTHLAVLTREGKIQTWTDQEIASGDIIDNEVVKKLAECDLFIPLVSPDFLASFYCYEKELASAVKRNDAGEMRIVPVVVEPCDWKGSPLKKFKALPKDGKPITEYVNHNVALLEVITGLRGLLEPSAKPNPKATEVVQDSISTLPERRYRAKRTFDAIDRQKFVSDTFEEVKKFFASSASELNGIEGFKSHLSEIPPHGFTCTVINKAHQQGTAHITVYMDASRSMLGDLYWSYSPNAASNTANGHFNVGNDDYEQYLTVQEFGGGNAQRINSRQAAEYLWDNIIGRAGISYD